jgi:F-type H+-transporting ATPase subunit delta
VGRSRSYGPDNQQQRGRSPVTSATLGTGLAESYAAALFELAEADKALERVATELLQIQSMIASSSDLERVMRSPVISLEDQRRAIDAVLAAVGSSDLVRRFVGLVGHNRRLYVLPKIIAAFAKRLAARRGETAAEVTSATPLSNEQTKAIVASLKKAIGSNVVLLTRTDQSLLGGLVVKVGSRMVDSSLKTKLLRLSLAIKGVG